MRRLLISLAFAASCFAQVQQNTITVTPRTDLSESGFLNFQDHTGNGTYVGFQGPDAVSQNTITAATAANPTVLTLISPVNYTITAGSTITISGVAGTGCSGLNGTQTVSSVGTSIPQTLTISYNNTGCSYTANSGAVLTNISWKLPNNDGAGPFCSDGYGRVTVGSCSGSSLTFGTGLNENGTSITFAQTDPTNILFNPGFEDSPALTQWTIETGTIVIDTTTAFNGNQSAKFTGTAKLDQRFQVQVGAQYSGTVEFIGSAGANGTAELVIAYEDKTGSVIAGQSFSATGTPSTSWQQLSLSTAANPAPSNAAYVLFQLYLNGNTAGYVDFDQATLRYIQQNDTVGLGSIESTNLAAGSLGDLSKYSSTVRAIGIVGGLPTCGSSSYPNGAIVFNTVDGKIYRCVGSTWSKGTDPQDIIAGTIASGVIYAGTINAGQVTAGTMSANFISGGTIDGSTINVTNLNASNLVSGSINASTITITNLNASNITTGTLNASVVNVTNLNATNITTGTLNASAINVTNLNASNISNGTVGFGRFPASGNWALTSEMCWVSTGSATNCMTANSMLITNASTVGEIAVNGNGYQMLYSTSDGALRLTGSSANLNLTGSIIAENSNIGLGSTGIAIGPGMNYQADGLTGQNVTLNAAAGTCTITVTGGIITSHSGC